MREFVGRQTATLVRKLAQEIARAAADVQPDAIHDLRVSIRRLSRCLWAFADFYPGRSWKKARAQLRELLHAAGEVRDRDIALEMLEKAGVGARSRVVIRLKGERAAAQEDLVDELRRWHEGKLAEKWGKRFEVRP